MKTVHVAAAIIKKENRILIAKRKRGEFAGLWEFPGGKLEAQETAEEALKREIQEEMELCIEVQDYLMTVEYDYETFHLSMDCFMCALKDTKFHLHDHTAVRWLDLENQEEIAWVPADVQVYAAVKNRYLKNGQ